MPDDSAGVVGWEARLALVDAEARVRSLTYQATHTHAGDPEVAQRLADARAELAVARARLAPAGSTPPSAGAPPKDTLLGAATTGVEAEPRLRLDPVPTGVVHLMPAHTWPLVETRLRNAGKTTARLRVSTWIEGYTAPFVESVELAPKAEATLRHLPTFFPAALAPVEEATRATVRVRVEHLDDGKVELERSWAPLLLPRSTAVRRMDGPEGWLDVTPWLAAWVTPNAPEVLELLREAAERVPGAQVLGYLGDTAAVAAQVQAAYEAVAERGLTYVNSVLTSGAVEGSAAQRVRLPREALAHRSANCIDGTVLLASVLEAASLHAGLVIVTGHALLAWDAFPGAGEWRYVETTMLGTHAFAEAVAEGTRRVEQARALKDPELRVLSVREARAAGVIPLE